MLSECDQGCNCTKNGENSTHSTLRSGSGVGDRSSGRPAGTRASGGAYGRLVAARCIDRSCRARCRLGGVGPGRLGGIGSSGCGRGSNSSHGALRARDGGVGPGACGDVDACGLHVYACLGCLSHGAVCAGGGSVDDLCIVCGGGSGCVPADHSAVSAVGGDDARDGCGVGVGASHCDSGGAVAMCAGSSTCVVCAWVVVGNRVRGSVVDCGFRAWVHNAVLGTSGVARDSGGLIAWRVAHSKRRVASEVVVTIACISGSIDAADDDVAFKRTACAIGGIGQSTGESAVVITAIKLALDQRAPWKSKINIQCDLS